MNKKIQSLLDGGFISIEDVLEYAQAHMDGVDQYDDEQIDKYEPDFNFDYEMSEEEKEYERMRMLDDMYGDDEGPEYDGAGFTERDEFPEYIIASTSYKLEETYIFQANENGEIHDFGEYGGLAKRWGDVDWINYYGAVNKTFGEGKYIFDRRIESGNSGVVHMLFRKIC